MFLNTVRRPSSEILKGNSGSIESTSIENLKESPSGSTARTLPFSEDTEQSSPRRHTVVPTGEFSRTKIKKKLFKNN